MPFSRRNRLRPINSVKQEITWSNLGQNAGTTITIDLVTGVDPAGTNIAGEVETGSAVHSVYVEMHFSAAQTGNANVIHWKIEKIPALLTPTIPSLYFQTDRKHILKRGMEMLPVNVATVFKRIFVVRIPRGISRFGDGDKLTLTYIASSTQTINACGFAIYKRYA